MTIKMVRHSRGRCGRGSGNSISFSYYASCTTVIGTTPRPLTPKLLIRVRPLYPEMGWRPRGNEPLCRSRIGGPYPPRGPVHLALETPTRPRSHLRKSTPQLGVNSSGTPGHMARVETEWLPRFLLTLHHLQHRALVLVVL